MPQLTKITLASEVKIGDSFTTKYGEFTSIHTVVKIRKTECRLFFTQHSVMVNKEGRIHTFKDGSLADSTRENQGMKPITVYFTPIIQTLIQ